MTIQSWSIYLALVLAATATPGPAVLFAVTNSTLHGWRKAVYSSLGNIAGLFCLGLVSVTGLGTLLETSETVFNVVRYSGAAYLIYLGLKQFFRKDAGWPAIQCGSNAKRISNKKVFFQAFGVAVGNPKAIMFLTALFPQFIHTDKPLVPQFSVLIITLMAFSFLFLMFYALLAHKTKTVFMKPLGTRAFNRTSGAVFIGFGLVLAASSNK